MNAPVHPAFASILGNICPPARKQPEVSGTVWRTVSYDGLMLDVYCDADGDYSGIALTGRKEHLGAVMCDEVMDEIQRMAETMRD